MKREFSFFAKNPDFMVLYHWLDAWVKSDIYQTDIVADPNQLVTILGEIRKPECTYRGSRRKRWILIAMEEILRVRLEAHQEVYEPDFDLTVLPPNASPKVVLDSRIRQILIAK